MTIVILLIILGIIVIQDFKERAISWWTIPIVFFASCYQAMYAFYFDYWMLGMNWFIVGLQLIILTIYFSIKHQTFVNITQQYFGIGDILFLLAIAPLFAPFLFCLFIVVSLLLTLLLQLLINNKQKEQTIPLAGFWAIYLILLLPSSQCFNFSLYNDWHLIQYIYG